MVIEKNQPADVWHQLKTLCARVKVICYQALIRPILTYGSYIWFNLCPSYMEKYRLIERKILSGYTHIIASSWTLSPIIVDDRGEQNDLAAILSKRSILCKFFKEWFRPSRSFYLSRQEWVHPGHGWNAYIIPH